MTPGALFRFPLGDGRYGAGKVLATHPEAVGVAVMGWIWDCEPNAADVLAAPVLLAHLALRELEGAEAVGEAPLSDEDRAAVADWDGSVVDAPLEALVAALA